MNEVWYEIGIEIIYGNTDDHITEAESNNRVMK